MTEHQIDYPAKPVAVFDFLEKAYSLKAKEFNDDIWRNAYEIGFTVGRECEVPDVKVEGTRSALAVAMIWADHFVGPYDIPDGDRKEHQRKYIGSFKSGITGAFFNILAKKNSLV